MNPNRSQIHARAKEPPPGWAACALSDAATPGRTRGNPADLAGKPFIGLEHVEAHTTRLLGFAPAETMKSSGVRYYEGDVLYGRMRPYLNKVWLADRDGLCSGEFIVFPNTGALRGAFLKYRLNAQDFVRFADHTTTGDRPRADFGSSGNSGIVRPSRNPFQRLHLEAPERFLPLVGPPLRWPFRAAHAAERPVAGEPVEALRDRRLTQCH